jgi:hypothetical protein
MIKPDMQQRFQMEKKNWFPRDDTPNMLPTTIGRLVCLRPNLPGIE